MQSLDTQLTFETLYQQARFCCEDDFVADSAQQDLSVPGFEQSGQFDERFLQMVWNEQAVSEAMRTTDGRTVEVIQPGVWNMTSGPDFQGAVIKLDNEELHGKVEVHVNEADWFLHKHGEDPAYKDVILHVFWHSDTSNSTPENKNRGLPQNRLCLAEQLKRSLGDLHRELQPDITPSKAQYGDCADSLADLTDDAVRSFFQMVGLIRFRRKAATCQKRIVVSGEEQALYEGMFETIGYRHNSEALKGLARSVPLSMLTEFSTRNERSAVLWGSAGVLPDLSCDPCDPFWVDTVRDCWNTWWRAGGVPLALPWGRKSRPLNSVCRRLAAGVEVLEKFNYQPAHAFKQASRDIGEGGRAHWKRLVDMLYVESDWDRFVDFEIALSQPAVLLGKARRGDILINCVLPFLYAVGNLNADNAFCGLIIDTYLAAPKLQDNQLLKEASQRFLRPPSRIKDVVKGAAEQQGVLGLYKDFCMRVQRDCANCPFSNPVLFEKLPFKK